MQAVELKGKPGWIQLQGLTSNEETSLLITGMNLFFKKNKFKVVAVSMEEADRMGLKAKKGAKKFELPDEDKRKMIELAVNSILRDVIRRINKSKKVK